MQTETEIQKLIALLNDPSWVTRRSAVQALGKLEAKEAIYDYLRCATIVALQKQNKEKQYRR